MSSSYPSSSSSFSQSNFDTFIEDEIHKRIFVSIVILIAILPRQHIDNAYCSHTRYSIVVGGNISRPFKKLLLCLALLNIVRLCIKLSPPSYRLQLRIVSDIMGILQQLGNSFLCFLSPYLLQTFMVAYINLPGGQRRPGANLMPPLYVSTLFSIAGVVLVRIYKSKQYWCLRKIGNGISVLPVVQTLQLYNGITTRGGSHEGRGTIISQSLMIVEYWYLVIQIISTISFIFYNTTTTATATSSGSYNDGRNSKQQLQLTMLDHIYSSFRNIGFYSDWIRILLHSIFINQLDELYLSTSPTSTSSSTNPTEGDGHESTNGGAGSTRRDEDMTTTFAQSSSSSSPSTYEMVTLVQRK